MPYFIFYSDNQSQPNVNAALVSPKAVATEPRKSIIGAKKPAKKGVSYFTASVHTHESTATRFTFPRLGSSYTLQVECRFIAL